MKTIDKRTIKAELNKILNPCIYSTINEQLNAVLYYDIEQDNKVKRIEQAKDYLNTNCNLYLFSINFGGGQMLEQYTTIAKIEIIQ